MCLSFFTNVVFAQTKFNNEEERNFKKASKLMHEQSFYNAIEIYAGLHKSYPKNEEVTYKLGLAYYITRDYKNAYSTLKEYASEKTFTKFPEAHYYLGLTNKSLAKYKEAQEAFTNYTKAKGKKLFLKNTTNEINSCVWAQTASTNDDSTQHSMHRLLGGMNRAYSDFSPLPVHKDTLIFASMQQDSILTYTHDDHHFNSVKLYEVTKKDSVTWGKPFELEEFNTPYEHTANGVISPDNKYFYFSRCVPNRANKIECRICVTEHDGDKIKQHAVKTVDGVNENGFNATQPTFQVIKKKDRKGKDIEQFIMYFVSDRPGGIGGKDIWYAIMNSHGKFGNPVNCGNRINTPGDEVSPFYVQNDGVLYFSSNYHFGFGGYDIFKSTGGLRVWTKPTNLSFPINTSYDDTYFTPQFKNSPENEGFLVSNRPGGVALHNETCCDDIYTFKQATQQLVELSSSIYEKVKLPKDSASNRVDTLKNYIAKPVNNARIGVIRRKVYETYKANKDTSLASLEQEIQWITSSDSTGKFQAKVAKGKQYVLVVQKENFKHRFLNTKQLQVNDSIFVDYQKDTTKEDNKIQKLTADIDINKAENKDKKFVLEHVYFDSNKDDIRNDAVPSLEILHQFLINNPKVKVELSGHTDNRGLQEYNLNLSQQRAEAIVAYLVQKGIEENRLVAKGYGEAEPLVPNTFPDGSDNPAGRAKNRRSEVKILHK